MTKQLPKSEKNVLLSATEEKMKKQKLPQFDTIDELAQFWDTHDLTDFEDELEEVTELIADPTDLIPHSSNL